jgi:hypothetical protein
MLGRAVHRYRVRDKIKAAIAALILSAGWLLLVQCLRGG